MGPKTTSKCVKISNLLTFLGNFMANLFSKSGANLKLARTNFPQLLSRATYFQNSRFARITYVTGTWEQFPIIIPANLLKNSRFARITFAYFCFSTANCSATLYTTQNNKCESNNKTNGMTEKLLFNKSGEIQTTANTNALTQTTNKHMCQHNSTCMRNNKY